MPLVTFAPEDEQARLAQASDWLADTAPALSARTLLSRGQRMALVATVVLAVLGAIVFPLGTGILIVGFITLLYLAIVVHRVYITVGSLRHPNLIAISDAEALALREDELPTYTVLVPIFREAAVVPQLVANLRALD